MTRIENSISNRAIFNWYNYDDITGDCEFSTDVYAWAHSFNDSYGLQSQSLVNQI